jgi:extradiol dioxygenase family protein
MFFLDPTGNALEFKAFKNIDTQLFALHAPEETGS